MQATNQGDEISAGGRCHIYEKEIKKKKKKSKKDRKSEEKGKRVNEGVDMRERERFKNKMKKTTNKRESKW
jgi:hypothetical protein